VTVDVKSGKYDDISK